MRKSPKLYNERVSEKIVNIINRVTMKNSYFNLFEFLEHEKLGLAKMPFWKTGETKW